MSAQPARIVPSLAGLHILFVDDSADERELFAVRFGNLGATVTAVASVDEALGELAEKDFDLVVSDICLPERDGNDLIGAVRSRPRSRGGAIPAIAVSGLLRERDVTKALEAGYQRFVRKPYHNDDVVSAVSELADSIAQHRAWRALGDLEEEERRARRERLGRRRAWLGAQSAQLISKYGGAALAEAVDGGGERHG